MGHVSREHKHALSLIPITAPGPVRVPVPWIVGHRGPAPFSLHGQLRPRTPFCPPGQQPQRAGSQGHWQVRNRTTTGSILPQSTRDQMLVGNATLAPWRRGDHTLGAAEQLKHPVWMRVPSRAVKLETVRVIDGILYSSPWLQALSSSIFCSYILNHNGVFFTFDCNI